MQVAAEHAGAALHVVPQRLPPFGLGALRRHQAGDDGSTDLAAMHVRPVRPAHVVVWHDVGRGLQADHAAERAGMPGRQVQHDPAPDRAAERNRPVQPQGRRHGSDHGDVGCGGELVVATPPALRRRRFAVERHVEHDAAEVPRDLGIRQQPAILPPVRPGGMQAQQRDALAGLLVIHPVRDTLDLEPQVAPDDVLDDDGAHTRRSRMAAKMPLNQNRCCISGRRSPSNRSVPRRTSAIRSW